MLLLRPPPGVLTSGKKRSLPVALSGQLLGYVLHALHGDGGQMLYHPHDSLGVHTSIIPPPIWVSKRRSRGAQELTNLS